MLADTLPVQMATSAGYGALYNFNSSRGSLRDRLEDGGIGGLTGMVAPVAGAGFDRSVRLAGRAADAAWQGLPHFVTAPARTATIRIGNAIRAAGVPLPIARAPITAELAAAQRAATAEGVDLPYAAVDARARGQVSEAARFPGAARPAEQGAERMRSQIGNRAAALGGDAIAQGGDVAGSQIGGALRNQVERFRGAYRAIGQRIDSETAGTAIVPAAAVQTLDGHIATLERTNGDPALIAFLRETRSGLVDERGLPRPQSAAALLDLKGGLGPAIDHLGLPPVATRTIMGDVFSGVDGDVRASLAAGFPRALRRYRDAARLVDRDYEPARQLASRIAGPASAERDGQGVNDQVRSLAASGDPDFARLWNGIGDEGRANFRAALIGGAGRDATDAEFSPPRFIADMEQIHPDARRAILGEDGARAIDNLTQLSRFQDDLRSAIAIGRGNPVSLLQYFAIGLVKPQDALIGLHPSAAALRAAARSLTLARHYLSPRTLMTPDFSLWVTDGTRAVTAEQVMRHIGQLGRIAIRNPAISSDVLGLRRALIGAMRPSQESTAPILPGNDRDLRPEAMVPVPGATPSSNRQGMGPRPFR